MRRRAACRRSAGVLSVSGGIVSQAASVTDTTRPSKVRVPWSLSTVVLAAGAARSVHSSPSRTVRRVGIGSARGAAFLG